MPPPAQRRDARGARRSRGPSPGPSRSPRPTHTTSPGSASRPRASAGSPSRRPRRRRWTRRGGATRKKPRDTVAAADGADSSDDGCRVGQADAAEGGDCSITIGSRPWSEVWIDGRNTTKHTPFADYKVPCGKHKISFKRPDLQIDHTETISVRAGQKFKQSFTLETEQPE